MLHLLFLPFRIIGAVAHAVFGFLGGILGIVGGVIGTVFGIIGGIIGLAWNLMAVGLIVGLIVAVFSRKRKPKDTYYVDGEEFTSYYNHK